MDFELLAKNIIQSAPFALMMVVVVPRMTQELWAMIQDAWR